MTHDVHVLVYKFISILLAWMRKYVDKRYMLH